MTVSDASEPTPGAAIVRADLAGTALFLVSGAIGSLVTGARVATVIVSVALFALGCVAFVISFLRAAERSRRDEIGVANLYLLTGETAPPSVKRTMSAALAVQIVACLAFGAIGFSGLGTDEVNPMAFGILVPTFGLGLNGMWAARHGRFGPRIVVSQEPRRRRAAPNAPQPSSDEPQPSSDRQMEKNARHD
jgi:hypothetical protein